MADWNLEVHLTWRDGAVVVTPRGEIDLLTVSQLEDALRRATWVRPKTVVVDLTETEFLACCGIGALAVVRTSLTASGRTLVVTGARGQVRRLLELCGEPPGDVVPVARASRRRVDRGSDRCRRGLLPGLHHLCREDRHRSRPSRASVTPESGP